MSVNYDKLNTYAASSAAFTPGATPQDVFTITGSSSSIIYVLKMGISTTQSTAGVNAWYLAKRSTANTGGTSSNLAEINFNSGNSAPTSIVLSYTANPTAGTLVGNVWSGHINSPAPATAGIGSVGLQLNFESLLGNPIVLVDQNQVLAWNFNGAALPTGLSVLAWVIWAESPKS